MLALHVGYLLVSSSNVDVFNVFCDDNIIIIYT